MEGDFVQNTLLPKNRKPTQRKPYSSYLARRPACLPACLPVCLLVPACMTGCLPAFLPAFWRIPNSCNFLAASLASLVLDYQRHILMQIPTHALSDRPYLEKDRPKITRFPKDKHERRIHATSWAPPWPHLSCLPACLPACLPFGACLHDWLDFWPSTVHLCNHNKTISEH